MDAAATIVFGQASSMAERQRDALIISALLNSADRPDFSCTVIQEGDTAFVTPEGQKSLAIQVSPGYLEVKDPTTAIGVASDIALAAAAIANESAEQGDLMRPVSVLPADEPFDGIYGYVAFWNRPREEEQVRRFTAKVMPEIDEVEITEDIDLVEEMAADLHWIPCSDFKRLLVGFANYRENRWRGFRLVDIKRLAPKEQQSILQNITQVMWPSPM